MTTRRGLVRRYVALRALRWLPLGLGLPFFILLPEDRGVGLGAIGAVWAVHSVITVVLEVPSGAIADAFGRRKTLLVGAALTAAGLAVYGVATAVAGFVLATASIAVGRALISGSLEAWFVDALRTIEPAATLRGALAAGTSAEALALGSGAIAGSFLPLLAGGLAVRGDDAVVQLSLPILAGAVAALVYLVAVWVLVEEAPRPRPEGRRAAARAATGVAREGLRVARASHNVRLLLMVAALLGVVVTATELLWQPRLEDLLGRDASDTAPIFGALSAATMVAVAAGAALSARLARRASLRRTYAGAILVVAAMLAALAVVDVTALFCVAYLAYFWGLGLAEPLHYEILHDAVEGPVRATVVSAESLTGQLGSAGGNLLLGTVAGAVGTGLGWAIAAVIAFVAMFVARGVRPAAALSVTPRPRPAAPSGAA